MRRGSSRSGRAAESLCRLGRDGAAALGVVGEDHGGHDHGHDDGEEPGRVVDQLGGQRGLEGATAGVVPPTLALRRETEDLEQIVDRLTTERAVRERVDGLNERIRKANVGLMDGPPVILRPLDADAVVAGWADRRSGR